jgi:hypothetical protein
MSIIIKILSIFGWQKLLSWTWEAILPSLEEIVKKTDTNLDNNMLMLFNKIIEELVKNGDLK